MQNGHRSGRVAPHCTPHRTPELTLPHAVERNIDRLLLERANADLEELREIQAKINAQRHSYKANQMSAMIARMQAHREYLLWRTFPINDLPPEIFQQILRDVVRSGTSTGQTTQSRLSLTGVCRYWRNQALDDPLLWNNVDFTDPIKYPFSRNLQFVRRAKNTEVNIVVTETPLNRLGKYLHEYTWLLRNMSPVLSQTRYMSFHIRYDQLMSSVLGFLRPVAIPLLDEFSVEYIPRQRRLSPRFRTLATDLHPIAEVFLRSTKLFGGGVPQLKYLTLTNVNLCASFPRCESLTCISLRHVYPTNDDFREMLAAAPRLRALRLHFAGPLKASLTDAHAPPVALPHLKELQFNAYQAGPSWVQNLLDQFSAPNLNHLSVRLHFWQDCTPLADMLYARFPQLVVLQLMGFHCPNTPEARSRIIDWFDTMPCLQVLRIDELSKHVLNCLTQEIRQCQKDLKKTQAAIVVNIPNLKVIAFEDQAGADIVEFARRRQELGAPLQRVSINSRCFTTFRVARADARLLAGLGVEVVPGWEELMALIGEPPRTRLMSLFL